MRLPKFREEDSSAAEVELVTCNFAGCEELNISKPTSKSVSDNPRVVSKDEGVRDY
jgi:hypothetical protein